MHPSHSTHIPQSEESMPAASDGRDCHVTAAADHADDNSEEHDCNRHLLWTSIAQVRRPGYCTLCGLSLMRIRVTNRQLWRLGYVLLTHAGRCLLHRQLQARHVTWPPTA